MELVKVYTVHKCKENLNEAGLEPMTSKCGGLPIEIFSYVGSFINHDPVHISFTDWVHSVIEGQTS